MIIQWLLCIAVIASLMLEYSTHENGILFVHGWISRSNVMISSRSIRTTTRWVPKRVKRSCMKRNEDDHDDGDYQKRWETIKDEYSKLYPIFDIIPDIMMASSNTNKNNIILQCPPGTGKTTIVPLALASSSSSSSLGEPKTTRKKHTIVVVEPRRVATKLVAQRMSSLLQSNEYVSFQIRGESYIAPQSRITVMTEGIALQKILNHNDDDESVIYIIDEFHERHLYSDIFVAFLRDYQLHLNPNIQIILMSATLFTTIEEQNSYTKMLGGDDKCQVLDSQGTQPFPVDVIYPTIIRKLLPLSVYKNDKKLFLQTFCNEFLQQQVLPSIQKDDGDVLIFLPGAKEINSCISILQQQQSSSSSLQNEYELVPLYGALSKSQQSYALSLQPNRKKRRIIVSSPIAEASLTLPRVTCVVDSGLCKTSFTTETGLSKLVTTIISKESAIQRMGRAGRTQKGTCFRFYTHQDYEQLFPSQSIPEISNCNPTTLLLLLLSWNGNYDTSTSSSSEDSFYFITPPNYQMINEYAIPTLEHLNIISTASTSSNQRYTLTSFGTQIIKYNLLLYPPRLSTCLIPYLSKPPSEALAYLILACILLEDDSSTLAQYRRRGRNQQNNNIVQQIQQLLQQVRQNEELQRNIIQYASRIHVNAKISFQQLLSTTATSTIDDEMKIQQVLSLALVPGYIHDLLGQYSSDASYGGSTYQLASGITVRLDDNDNDNARKQQQQQEYLLVLDTSTSDDGKTRIRSYCPISLSPLDYVKEYMTTKQRVFTVPSRGHELRARLETSIGSIITSSQPISLSEIEHPEIVIPTTFLSSIQSFGGGITKMLIQSDSQLQQLLLRLDLLSSSLTTTDDHYLLPEWYQNLKVSDDDNKDSIWEELLEPYLISTTSLKSINMYDIVQSTLSMDILSILEQQIPTRIKAPDESWIPLIYYDDENDSQGSITVKGRGKLQQFFGWMSTPNILTNDNKIKVQLELTSPAGKILATTHDLSFFWQEVYPQVRLEMRGRYPKHPWPENPLTATPTQQTKKQLQKVARESSPDDNMKVDKRKEKRNNRRKNKK